jgi:hypothetical protein
VDIRYVDVHRVSAYLSKYLTKESANSLPKGIRRFSCSKGIVLWGRTTNPHGWFMCWLSLDYLRELARIVDNEQWEKEDEGVFGLRYFEGEYLGIAGWARYVRPMKIRQLDAA